MLRSDLIVHNWKELVGGMFINAAGGYLADLFIKTESYQRSCENLDDGEVVPEGYPEEWAVYREALMEILEDEDGSKLTEWMTLFRKKRTFTRKGRSESFESQAHSWAIRCWREMGGIVM